MLKKFLYSFLVLFFLPGQVLADDSVSKLKIPNPAIFLTSDTVSLTVVKATPEDAGFKSLFDTAWKALEGSNGLGSNFLYKAGLYQLYPKH